MSALAEDRCYGLSSGKLSSGGVSVFHVKLTDSAARAIGAFHNGKDGFQPTICFLGNQGRITVPCSDSKDEVRVFTFSVSNVARNNPHGSFDCVKQLCTGAAEELSCLGVIQKKMTVNATDDSYDKARQSMAQAEEETRSRGAIVIKNGGRFQGKKVTVRAPAPALAMLTKPKHSSHALLSNMRRGGTLSKPKKGPCPSSRSSATADVIQRPIKERVMHLLALRPYKRPELILRLQKDGLTEGEKDGLDSILTEVAQLSSRDNAFVLKDRLYKELQKDWPGYTAGDQQLLKRILVRRLFQPQPNILRVPEAQVSPLRDTPNSSPVHCFKHSLAEDYTDPLLSKKPRISHLSTKTARRELRLKPAEQVDAEATVKDERWDPLDPKELMDSLSAVCDEEAETADRLKPCESAQDASEGDPAAPPPPERPHSPITLKCEDKGKKKKKSKLKKEKDGWRKKKERRKDQTAEDQNKETSQDCSSLAFESDGDSDEDSHDYLIKYTAIGSQSQRQSYKQDFNKEYSEYRDLHSRIDVTTQQFMELESQLKRLHHDSLKYKTVHNKILQKYKKIKKSNPNYHQDKLRCEYLHNKLAHIKKLISDFDQQQLQTADQSCPE